MGWNGVVNGAADIPACVLSAAVLVPVFGNRCCDVPVSPCGAALDVPAVPKGVEPCTGAGLARDVAVSHAFSAEVNAALYQSLGA